VFFDLYVYFFVTSNSLSIIFVIVRLRMQALYYVDLIKPKMSSCEVCQVATETICALRAVLKRAVI